MHQLIFQLISLNTILIILSLHQIPTSVDQIHTLYWSLNMMRASTLIVQSLPQYNMLISLNASKCPVNSMAICSSIAIPLDVRSWSAERDPSKWPSMRVMISIYLQVSLLCNFNQLWYLALPYLGAWILKHSPAILKSGHSACLLNNTN